MKIALFGYGKMGKEVEKVALQRGHEIAHVADSTLDINPAILTDADAAIDFTSPDGVVDNILKAFESDCPIIVGTTGWYNDFEKVKKACSEKDGALFYATNFSIGVNLFFQMNEQLARLMNEQSDYHASVSETHHKQKLDSPSGTAITTAEGILENIGRLENWKEYSSNEEIDAKTSELPVFASREEGVVGIHEVTYKSAIDQIQLKHKAFTRQGFAKGSVIAAEWMKDKTGIYNMKDLLGLNN